MPLDRKERAWQGTPWTIGAMATAGALAGSAWYVLGVPFGDGELVALLFVAASLSAIAALALPLRRAVQARAVAALAAWACVAAFFATPLALGNAPLPRASVLALLGIAPLVTAAIAFAGAAYLARGARRARVRRAVRQP